MARTKSNIRSFAPWTSQGLARVVGRSNEPAKERSTLMTPEKQPLGPATATPDHAIQPPLPSLAPPLESDRSSRLSRTQPYNPAIRHAPLEELTPRNLYSNFPSPAGPATPVVPPPPSPTSQPHPAVAAVTEGVQGRGEPGLRSGCARLEQADGAGPSQPAAGSGVAAAEARPRPSQPAAATPPQATSPGPAAALHGISGAMHARLPSLAGHPAPSMQANTTPMPTHNPVVDAPELQPGTIARSLHMAWMLQLELVGCRRALTATKRPVPQNASQRFLDLMATAGSEVILDSRSEKGMVPVICIPSDIQSSLHQLPPPFLVRFQDINDWKMLWKAPSFPWSSMLQQWVMVDWFANEPGYLVLGLRAAGSTGPAAHGPTSLHTPQVQTASPWPPPFQHHGFQGAQLAATARQMPVTACGAATPPVATPAPPCGPGPREGRQDCSGVQGQANMSPECDHIHQEHCTSTPPQQPRPVSDGRQGEEVKAFIEAAYPPVAHTAAQPGPGTIRERLMKAIQLQRQLLSGRLLSPGGIAPVHSTTSHTILRMMATATSVVDLNNMWDQSAVPVICMPCGGQSSLPELPPPFLVRIRGNNHWEMLWKASSFPWPSLLQLWEMVVWSTEAPGGHLVLWLRAAASTGSPVRNPTSLHTPQALSASPRPPLYTPHQQGQGAQLAATARQIPAVGCQAATPPVAAPAPPCGPGPQEGRQDCSGPEGRAGPNSVAGFKRNVSDTVQGNAKRQCGSQGHNPSLAAGVEQPAPDQGPEDMEVAPAALPESSAPDGGAAAAGGLGTAEEGGPGPSQPAAGMAGAPDEGDPEVPQPAAPHAGLDPGSGQDTIDLTQEGPAADQSTEAMQLLPRAAVPAPAPPPELPGASEMKLEGGLGWAQLIDNIITVLDKHLPDEEKPKIADALNRMEQWRASSEGLVHLQSLAEAYTLARKKCARFTPKLYAWILLKDVEPLLQA